MISVIVVPETDEFKNALFHGEKVYINEALGEPQLKTKNAKYLAPYLLTEKCVLRLYEIIEMKHIPPSYEIYLGNSFLVTEKWDKINQPRKFEYHKLEEFNFIELKDGFLFPHIFI